MMPGPPPPVAPRAPRRRAALACGLGLLLVGCREAVRPPDTWDPGALGAGWVALGDADTKGLGTSLSVVDWNGDGRLDLLAGAPGDPRGAGRVLLFLAGDDGLPDTPSHVATDGDPGGGFGRAIDVGDVDGDGVPDLVSSRRAGRGVVILGGRGAAGFGPTLATLDAPQGWTLAATALRIVDLGAGLELVAVGAMEGRREDPRLLGTVHIWSMPGGDQHRVLMGPEAGLPLLGLRILGAADLDGDGDVELAVGAGSAGLPGTSRGAIWTLGRDGRRALEPFAGPDGSRLGSSGVVLGDLDGDGAAELAAGSPHAFRGGGEDGYVVLLGVDDAGRGLSPRWESAADADGSGRGRALAAGCRDDAGAILLAMNRGRPRIQNPDGTVIEVHRVGAALVPEPVAAVRLPTNEWEFGEAMALAPLGADGRCQLVVGLPALRREGGAVGALASYEVGGPAGP